MFGKLHYLKDMLYISYIPLIYCVYLLSYCIKWLVKNRFKLFYPHILIWWNVDRSMSNISLFFLQKYLPGQFCFHQTKCGWLQVIYGEYIYICVNTRALNYYNEYYNITMKRCWHILINKFYFPVGLIITSI